MMKSNDSQSIHQLIIAEKKAEDRIQQARKRKAGRLKQAKDEAHNEIQKFKDEKEEGFIESLKKFSGTEEETTSKIKEDAAQEIVNMEQKVEKGKEKIVEFLMDKVFTINCEVHKNFDSNYTF